MKYKTKILIFILVLLLLWVYNGTRFTGAKFVNVTPAEITIKDITYSLTDEILSENQVGKQIGKINEILLLVSYLEEDNPYKNPNKVYEIKNIKAEDAIAVQVNVKLYKAEIKK